MTRRLPRSLLGVALLGCSVLLPLTVVPARADAPSLVLEQNWATPAGHAVMPAIAFDGPARAAYVLLGQGGSLLNRAMVVDPGTMRPRTPTVTIPDVEQASPLIVDERRHLLIYVEAVAGNNEKLHSVASRNLVGIGLRSGSLRLLFKVPWRGTQQIAGMTLDNDGQDLFLLGAGTGGRLGPHIDRVSVKDLVAGTFASPWTQPYAVAPVLCPEALATNHPAGLLAHGNTLHFGCRPTARIGGVGDSTLGQTSGVMRLSGVTRVASPEITATIFSSPGAHSSGDSLADTYSRRLVLAGKGPDGPQFRVFDTDHSRYVGLVRGPGLGLQGMTNDPTTGRLYSSGGPVAPSLALSDLGPLLPTQGEIVPAGTTVNDNNRQRRMAYDPTTKRLFVAHQFQGKTYLAILRDNLTRYAPQPPLNYDAGALDAVDRPGVTDSSRAAGAGAYGAEHSLIGGIGALYGNASNTQDSTATFKGTRYLRQAAIGSASLTSSSATATAVLATEDSGTDQNRQAVSAESKQDLGHQFAKPAECSDFGSTPSKQPVKSMTAQVSCDLEKGRTHAAATFTSPGGFLMTLPGQQSGLPVPIEVGRATSEVTHTRAPGRGRLTTTVTASAHNIDLFGEVSIGSVTSTVMVSTHGRSGTALASEPKVTITGLAVAGKPACAGSCSLEQAQTILNEALGSRGHVEIPQASVIRTRGGTLASVGQDPWMHAEQVLDYEREEEDYTVPAMTLIVYLEGQQKSRLVVNLAAISASSIYRVFPLMEPAPPAPEWTPPPGASLPPPPDRVAPPHYDPPPAGPIASPTTSGGGLLNALVDTLRLSLRSPSQALPLILIWSLFAIAPYLSARRRLLLELPLLTREQDVP